jgi:DNA-binding YbaB/EbfC family protein
MFKGLGDMGKMMRAAQDVQERMGEVQQRLESITVEGEAGAGMVRATATAKGEVTALSIDPSIFSAEDREVVEDLIVAAIADAQAKAKTKSQEEMGRMAEGLGLPPGFKLPF